jgi:hypothetical protein
MPVLYPACFKDTVRYVTSVPASQICTPGQAGVVVAIGLPIGGIVTMLVILMVSFLLWWRRGWPWLALGTLLSAAMLRLPATVAGPFGTFLGDLFSMGAMAWTLVHFSDLRRQGAAQGGR